VIEQRVLPHPGMVWHLKAFRTREGLQRILSAGPEAIRVWDPDTGQQTAAFDDLAWALNAVEVCHLDGRNPVVAIGTDDGVEWFDVLTGSPCYGPTVSDTIWGLAATRTPDGANTLFSTGYMSPFMIHRWDAATGRQLADIGPHDDHLVAISAVNVPGHPVMVAATGWAEVIYRWDPFSGLEYGPPLVGNTSIIHMMDTAALPDGQVMLVTGDSDGTVRRWDVYSGEQIGAPIKAHDEQATVHVLSYRGRPQILTSGQDEIVRRWDALSGELLDEPARGFKPLPLTIDGAPAVATGGKNGLTIAPLLLC
jgi:WD40 repeat protein